MPKKTNLSEAWENVKNNANVYCVLTEDDSGYCGTTIFKVLKNGKFAGWRVMKKAKIIGDLPADYDMTNFGQPWSAEDGDSSYKKIVREWEKIKKSSKSYYVDILDINGTHIGIEIHKILKNGKFTGWRVKEEGKKSYDLPADYDMTQFSGFPEASELDEEDLIVYLTPSTYTTPP